MYMMKISRNLIPRGIFWPFVLSIPRFYNIFLPFLVIRKMYVYFSSFLPYHRLFYDVFRTSLVLLFIYFLLTTGNWQVNDSCPLFWQQFCRLFLWFYLYIREEKVVFVCWLIIFSKTEARCKLTFILTNVKIWINKIQDSNQLL